MDPLDPLGGNVDLGKGMTVNHIEALKAMSVEMGKVSDRQAYLNRLYKDPIYQARVVHLRDEIAATTRLRDIERSRQEIAQRSRALGTGSFARDYAQRMTQMRQAERLAQVERGIAAKHRLGQVASGGFASDARAKMQADDAERRAMQAEERERQKIRGERLASGQFVMGAAAEHGLKAGDRRLARGEREELLLSGQYAKSASDEARDRIAHQRLGVGERQAMLSGGHFTANAAAQHGVDMEQAKVALAERHAMLTSGQYAKQLADTRQLAREKEKIDRLEHRTRLQARYGQRLGGALATGSAIINHPLARIAGGAALVGSAAIATTAKRGFSGTVEGTLLSDQFTLLSRELAGSFVPVIKFTTRALQTMRHWLEKLDGRGQNLMMAGGMIAGGVGLLGGMGRMLAPLFKGGAIAAGAGGAGGLGGGIAAGGIAAGGIAAGGMLAGTAGKAGSGGLVRGLGKRLAKAVPVAGAAYTAYDAWTDDSDGTESLYDMRRRRGNSKLTAGVMSYGESLIDTGSDVTKWLGLTGSYKESLKNRGMLQTDPSKASKRDRVTPADAGFMEAGSSYYRLSEALTLRSAQDTEGKDTSGLSAIGPFLQEIKPLLEKIAANADRQSGPVSIWRGG